MTMKITIANEDQTRIARVQVRDHTGKPGTGGWRVDSETEIPPGETRSFFVHSTRDLFVEEVQIKPAE